jgi:hypothetical protein
VTENRYPETPEEFLSNDAFARFFDGILFLQGAPQWLTWTRRNKS